MLGRMDSLKEVPAIDWTDCPLVEINPRKLSGVPVLKGTRMQADSIVQNYQSGSPVEEIAENFDIPEESIRDLLAYAARKNPALMP
jgi:uncharacterized protein (DUF433 family)